ncbi:MAG: hypothetical protein IT303_13425 [Dehalococcoidia bacterium]|nr:hypothetical protein [Dehalococcoidia bacterium]
MSVTLPAPAIPAPIREEPEGTYRVGHTKVLLAAFIWAYNHESDTAEKLHDAWPVVELPLVFAVLAYYHQNRAAVDTYVEQTRLEQERFVEEQKRLHPQDELMDRLRARKWAKDAAAAASERHDPVPRG